ncbi:VCBS domain-containing protein [Segatella salivae]|uniref:toxin-antitoxin system YwqK family antitoxin n=1 Tax=Segatella salivae TaxID=228604 RepID=UPI0028EF6B2D|nr:VCBS domain-containing protein [Segatella salivae]
MKRILLISVIAMMTITSYARKHVAENAVVVADTIYYAADKTTVNNNDQASYYRLLMKQNHGVTQRDVFQDFYMDGTLKAEGEYSFIDLGNDANTVLNGEVTTYYPNGKEKWHGKYMQGKREGYFTLHMREGGIAVVQFKNGKSLHDYFTITHADGTIEKRPIAELKVLM